jgi:hypothetical protein
MSEEIAVWALGGPLHVFNANQVLRFPDNLDSAGNYRRALECSLIGRLKNFRGGYETVRHYMW